MSWPQSIISEYINCGQLLVFGSLYHNQSQIGSIFKFCPSSNLDYSARHNSQTIYYLLGQYIVHSLSSASHSSEMCLGHNPLSLSTSLAFNIWFSEVVTTTYLRLDPSSNSVLPVVWITGPTRIYRQFTTY